MINSRNINDLLPHAAELCRAFIDVCQAHGIDVIITSTYRDTESQAAIYAQGRTAPGNIVTNAKPGMSYHNWRVAFDFCPIVNGKAQWNDLELFHRCGELAESVGLEWAGRWKRFPEMAHCQWTDGHDLAWFQLGNKLPEAKT